MATGRKGPQRVERASTPGGLAGNQISPQSTTGSVASKLRPKKERIVVGGDVYVGKSYFYMRMAHIEWQRGQDEPDYDPKKFYILDLDDTTSTFMSEDEEFEHLYHENGGNVYPFPAFEWSETAKAYRQIIDLTEQGDWVVIDTIGRLYEQAQAKTAKDLGINIDDVAYERTKNQQGFGAFDGNQWNLVGRVLGTILNHAVYQGKAHLMLTAHLRDVVEMRAKRENLTMYQQIGFEPIGPPRMHGMVRSFVFLWANRLVKKDKGRIVSSRIARHITVTKDRGSQIFEDREYTTDGWETLRAIRKDSTKARREAMNVSGEEAETLEPLDMAERKIDDESPEL